MDSPTYWPREPLAYIEWYAPLAGSADSNHGMYQVKKASLRKGGSLPAWKLFRKNGCLDLY
ncbi:hypothetical protein M405DRAFT_870118 [Rhizopogon salebrosus TDB-379]|nr:hypothetical protein M405DRAFT_870118 [Rhizopogon salebrosus TDB-379]